MQRSWSDSIDLYINMSTVAATYLKRERNNKLTRKKDTNKYVSYTVRAIYEHTHTSSPDSLVGFTSTCNL
jgi:hypothetical protein